MRLSNRKQANRTRTIPDIVFIHFKIDVFVLFPIKHTPRLKINHHKADPKKTPKITILAERGLVTSLVIFIPVKIAANPKIVIGLLVVMTAAERKSEIYPLFPILLDSQVWLGSLRILYHKNIKNKTANDCKISLYANKKFHTNATPKTAIHAYIPSIVAVHIPVINPERRPLLRLRRIQRIPTGPIGAAIENQIIIHFNRRGRCIIVGRE